MSERSPPPPLLWFQKRRSKLFNLCCAAWARSPPAPGHFLGNDIKAKSELLLADERPDAALQPASHDRQPIKGNPYLTRRQKALQNAGRRFILLHNKRRGIGGGGAPALREPAVIHTEHTPTDLGSAPARVLARKQPQLPATPAEHGQHRQSPHRLC